MIEINALNIVEIALAIVTGVFAGLLVVFIFNRLPAEWLCEYGQQPSAELKDPNIRRIKENPWRWVSAAAFACIGVRLICAYQGPLNIQLALTGMFVCWVMVMIGLADKKYMIIPDQFVVALALGAIGFIPVHKSLTHTLEFLDDMSLLVNLVLGLVLGAGTMLAVAGIGALVTKKEAVGFGDVKLCGALGLLLGLEGIITTLVLGVLASGLYAAALLTSGKAKKNDALPMGPFLCGGAMAYIIIVIPFLLLYN